MPSRSLALAAVQWILIVGLGLAGGLFAGAAVFAPAQSPGGKLVTSAAIFAEDRRLESCVDVFADKGSPKVNVANNSRFVNLSKSCAEQFSDRTALATCVVKHDRVTSVDYVYDARQIDSDAKMRDCLVGNGKWTVNPDSRLVAREMLRQSMRDIDALSGGALTGN